MRYILKHFWLAQSEDRGDLIGALEIETENETEIETEIYFEIETEIEIYFEIETEIETGETEIETKTETCKTLLVLLGDPTQIWVRN